MQPEQIPGMIEHLNKAERQAFMAVTAGKQYKLAYGRSGLLLKM